MKWQAPKHSDFFFFSKKRLKNMYMSHNSVFNLFNFDLSAGTSAVLVLTTSCYQY